jgi:hypothetical protein
VLEKCVFLSSDEASYERSSYSSAITDERKRSRVDRRARKAPTRGEEMREEGKEELQGHKRSPVAKRKKKRNTKCESLAVGGNGEMEEESRCGEGKGKKERAKRRERLPLSQSKQEN